MQLNEDVLTGRPPHNPMWEAVLAALRMAIIKGQLPSGTHLLELGLAERLGVSRGPVREALIRLEQEGLVINQPYRGKFVADISAQTIREIYSLRILLESFAADLCIDKLQPTLLQHLRDSLAQMIKAADEQRFEEFADIDLEFHRQLVVAAEHTRLLQMWETLRGVNHAFIAVNASMVSSENVHAFAERHELIVDALTQRDVVTVKEILRIHLAEAEARILAVMLNQTANL